MSLERDFRSVARQIGQTAEVWRDGVLLGRGAVWLDPVVRREHQFVPTDLGVARRQDQVCYGEAGLPLEPGAGETLLKTGGAVYRVLEARERHHRGRRVFWVAFLAWREEDEEA